jgi:hypothetical protein
VGANGFVMPAPEVYLKPTQSFTHARCCIAAISVEVNMGVKTNNFDRVFFDRF